MSESRVLVDISDRIATVTLNDLARRNLATGSDMIVALLDAFARMHADPEISVMILTGAAPAICAGGDTKEMADPQNVFLKDLLAAADSYLNGIQLTRLALFNLDILIIAAVNGLAVGAGCDLTMMCDMSIATEGAQIDQVFLRPAIIPGDAGSRFLLQRLGHQKNHRVNLLRPHGLAGRGAGVRNGTRGCAAHRPYGVGAEAGVGDRHQAAPRGARRQAPDKQRRAQLSHFQSTGSAYQAPMHQTKDHNEALAALFDKRKLQFSGH